MSTISRHSVQSNLNKQTQQRKALKGTVHDLHSQILFEISMMDWGQVMHYRWHIWHTLLPQGHFSHKWRWSPLFHLPGFQAVHDAIASLRNIGDTKAKLDKEELQRNIKQIQRNMVELKELWLACCYFFFFYIYAGLYNLRSRSMIQQNVGRWTIQSNKMYICFVDWKKTKRI